MKTIRNNVFETNSSSTHNVSIFFMQRIMKNLKTMNFYIILNQMN